MIEKDYISASLDSFRTKNSIRFSNHFYLYEWRVTNKVKIRLIVILLFYL